jgi:hypothetical protein
MQPHPVRAKLPNQPVDALSVGRICRRTQQLRLALDLLIYLQAGLADSAFVRYWTVGSRIRLGTLSLFFVQVL